MSTDPLDIATRHGLPDEFQGLLRQYPRADWRDHAGFSGLTSMWLDRHMMFRDVLSRMQTTTQTHLDQPQDRFGPEIARYTGFLLNQLHEHHMVEDQHYFPQLKGFDPRLERAFEMLDRDHHALDGHIHGLASATNGVLERLNAAKPAEAGPLHDAQRAFEAFLDRHLADEEDIIVPVLLKYGPEMG